MTLTNRSQKESPTIYRHIGPDGIKRQHLLEIRMEKHGTCYMNITKAIYPTYKQNEIFTLYFSQAVNKLKSLALKPTESNYTSVSDFDSDLPFKLANIQVICGDHNELDQLRICYNIDQPGSQIQIACPSFHRQCSGAFSLKDFAP